jgi:protein-tyrosine phosphatase
MAEKFSISKITPNLYVSGWPKGADAERIVKMGFDLILHLLWQPADKKLKEDENLKRVIFVDSPIIPIPIKRLEKGVNLALPVLAKKGKVLIYCKSGVHRSVAMACCVLIALGKSAEEAMAIVKKKRPLAKPETSYIKKRIVKFEKYWNENRAKKNNL